MAALPEPPSDSAPPHWDYWRHDLWTNAQEFPVESFWNWPCVRHTMLVEHFNLGPQLDYLRPDRARWEVGTRNANNADTRNLIMQAYHLKLWEDTTGQRVEDLRTIYEFGAGYGALALLAHRMGFRGEYYVYDLPEFVLLQRWFLDQHGIQVHHTTRRPVNADLFVALYSISEVPLALRSDWLSTCQAQSYLLLYSGRFADYDNAEWAQRLAADRPDLSWLDEQFPGRPDNYLIGRKP